MIKKSFPFLILILLVLKISFAQQTPLNFSDDSHSFSSWGGSTFDRLSGPIDSNNITGQFFRNSSASEQGNYIDLSRPINLDVEDEITMRFYSFDPLAHTIIVKLENGTNPNVELAVLAPVNQNAWSDLLFDFSTVNASGSYSRLVIRIDDGSTVPGAFRIDDINDGNIATDPNAIDIEYTDLVWSDEFNTSGKTTINSLKWFHQTQLPSGGSWFNGEEQHYTNRIENSFVENGNLNIVAIKESFTDQGETKQYTSARLNSKFAFTYGRVDVRAKLPFGEGTWPAIWTLGKNINEMGAYWQTQGFGTTSWPACGEIDIMEHGLGAVNHTSSALHTPSSSGATINTDSQLISDVANNYHIYSVNWSPNQITFLVDGVGYYTYNPAVKDSNTWPFNKDQYLLLNIAMGGVAGTIDSNFTQSPMLIDYVRVYQNNALNIEKFNAFSFDIYPNPTNDFVSIVSDENIHKVLIIDVLGNTVIDRININNNINISSLSKGLYFLRAYSGDRISVKKLVVN